MNRAWLIVCALSAVICCANSADFVVPFFTKFIQATTCNQNIDGILKGIMAKESPQQCSRCDMIADMTRDLTDFSQNAHRPVKNLVGLYCVKAGSSKVFRLNLSNAKKNPTKKFDPDAQYAFLIHGFTDTYPGQWLIQGEGWMQRTIIEWAKYGLNVCAVDWGSLSIETLNYFVVSQKNTVRVANYLFSVLQRFERYGMDLANTTLAGHSLGAQISGKVGAALRKKGKMLGRIYGIDPAGPCYTHPCTASENDRLDASDANYVQCIHSNIGYWGTIPRCGCEDFYLNSGVIQPGAFEPTSSHYYSVNIFEWTLNPKHKCYSTSGRQLLGVNSRGVCGVYKVKTLAGQPYC